MKYFKLVSVALVILANAIVVNAQTRSINSITYEKVGTEWYQSYNCSQYEVDETVVTVKFINGLSEAQKASVASANGCSIINSNLLGYYDLQINSSTCAVDVVESLQSTPISSLRNLIQLGSF